MFSSHLYWFIYRRRNKFLILLMTIFCILIYFHQNDRQVVSSTIENQSSQIKIDKLKKIRINRETYTIPEPCHGCPGEDGQGVQLNVIFVINKFHCCFFDYFLG